jgi:hypothetical protein
VKSALSGALNLLARPLGAAVVPAWRWRQLTAPANFPTFRFGGRDYPFLLHHYNCGPRPATNTERTVELPLADRWLDKAPADTVVEVGAVTPYYWPGRVRDVVDPADPHPGVTRRASLLDLDLTGRAVLCVSTLEHVGSGDYGQAPDPDLARRAVDKLLAEAAAFLVTGPSGYNPVFDRLVFDAPPPPGVTARYLVRRPDAPYWEEAAGPADARRSYGPPGTGPDQPAGANAIVVWERGGYLD